MRLVIFDFDGTIHLQETGRLFLRVLNQDPGNRKKVGKLYVTLSWVYILYRFGLCRQLMVKLVQRGIAKIMSGMSREQIANYFQKCLATAEKNFSPVSLQQVKAHIGSGDRILLLSGAFSQFIALVAEELGMHYWIGTELELSGGLCTGRISSLLIGVSKVRALKAFLQEQKEAGVDFDLDDAYAYADAIHDLPLLSLVGRPVAVNPDHRLLKESEKRGWEIIRDN